MKKKWVVAEKISDDIVSQLLYNRGLKDKNAIANFFNPPTPEAIVSQYTTYLSKIDPKEVEKAVSLTKEAIDTGRPIAIHGDFDVDGLCGTAILYQALKNLGANVAPFIPDRFEHGYGLSIKSLKKIQSQNQTPSASVRGKQFIDSKNRRSADNLTINNSPLLITTDCGIGAVDEVKYAKSQGFDIIITDHHTRGETLPEADAIVWTDGLAGAGIAYVLALRLATKLKTMVGLLDLVALATIADVLPLTGVNRALVKYGLEELNSTRRVGLKELIKITGLEEKEIGPYEVGWMLAPRLNASGRLGNASDSLKLLLTENAGEAQEIASKLNQINSKRQQLTQRTLDEARRQVNPDHKVIILHNETWHEGIAGLVAGRLKEEFYRPTVIIAGGEEVAKGSARSIRGFNIVGAIRECKEFLVDAGGHAMAAGLTIEAGKIPEFREKLIAVAGKILTEELLTPILKIDVEAALADLNWNLIKDLKKFEPFGVGNPKPTFLTKSVRILSIRAVGNNGKHLKLQIRDVEDITMQPSSHLPCIGFGFGEWASQLRPGNLVDIVYNFEENHWNDRTTLQLKLKDLRKNES